MALIADTSKEAQKSEKKSENKSGKGSKKVTTDNDIIEFADFAKIDLRVAKILEANHVEGADKLLQLTLDIGDKQINVFSGIKSHYQPEDIVGRLTVVVANLQPRKMKFGVSEGMVLCAGEGKELWLLEVNSDAIPGMPVA